MIGIDTMVKAIVQRIGYEGFLIVDVATKYQEEHNLTSIEVIAIKDEVEVQAGFLYQPIPCYFDTPKLFCESMVEYVKNKEAV